MAIAHFSYIVLLQQASYEERQMKLGEVLCAVAEVYMTDLSWEEDAEQRCETLVTEAMLIAPSSPETWQTVANVRISQERVDEARAALKRSLELWQDLPPEHAAVPEFPVRIGLARLLLEVEMEEEASIVLERLVNEDDQSVEAWYLGGWCLYIVGEKVREAKAQDQNGEVDAWKSVWASARRWLMSRAKHIAVVLKTTGTYTGGASLLMCNEWGRLLANDHVRG